MPILVDFNQIAISNLMISLKMGHIDNVEEGMLRHMILNSLRFNRNKFNEKYGVFKTVVKVLMLAHTKRSNYGMTMYHVQFNSKMLDRISLCYAKPIL